METLFEEYKYRNSFPYISYLKRRHDFFRASNIGSGFFNLARLQKVKHLTLKGTDGAFTFRNW